MNEIEYIKKNAHKADTILRKLAFPSTSRSFAGIDDIFNFVHNLTSSSK